MRFSIGLVGTLALSVAASPLNNGYHGVNIDELVGYGKNNPIGPTTGGKGGKSVTVSTAEALVAAVAGTQPSTIYVKGSISLPARLRPGSNKSILGLGNDAEILENGISIVNQTNVIIRNLAIRFIRTYEGQDPSLRPMILSDVMLRHWLTRALPLAQSTTTALPSRTRPGCGSIIANSSRSLARKSVQIPMTAS